jgi:uncharacterized membrane protein (DUF2068 family)
MHSHANLLSFLFAANSQPSFQWIWLDLRLATSWLHNLIYVFVPNPTPFALYKIISLGIHLSDLSTGVYLPVPIHGLHLYDLSTGVYLPVPIHGLHLSDLSTGVYLPVPIHALTLS